MDEEKKAPTQPPLAPPPIPKMIGPYKIESLYKKGGMSFLYLGIHPKTSETVIIKVPLPQFLKNKDVLTRLVREAKILGLANHPNIVKLYDLGQWENGIFVAMEFVNGVSLKQFIKKNSFTHRRALEIVLQIAYALLHLHSHGVIHRDVKPENVILTESGEVKLIDYGISLFFESPEHEHLTKRVLVMGTPHYMSPEQADRPDKVSYNTDIYSLGIIAYELFLGQLRYGIIQPALLPRGMKRIIEKTLQSDPKKRYGDIVEFITDITQYLKTIDEKKEEKEEVSDEIYELIENTRSMLVPHKPPRWPELDIGIAFREGSIFHGLYFDFLSQSQTQFAMILAESHTEGADSLTRLSLLRGIVRSVWPRAESPRQLILAINHVLHADPIRQQFNFSLLWLNGEKNTLSYISCGEPSHSFLYSFREGNGTPHILEVQNPPLGTESLSEFLEIGENWNPGDTLFFSSFKPPKGVENNPLLLPPRSLAEMALKETPSSGPQRSRAFVVTHLV